MSSGRRRPELMEIKKSNTEPSQARDLDLACEGVTGWKLYELGARLEEELQVSLDLIPLTPSTRLTRIVELRGKVLL
jgi:hypothetical protein